MSRAREVRARACCRVDLAGGTLDIWPLGLLHPGAATVNVAIDLEAEVGIREQKEGYRLRFGDQEMDFDLPEQVVADERTRLIGLVVSELGLPPAEIRVESGSP
ncbi:MAG: hypothetical protein OES47_09290, partial [Acidobacteriota bacterium]|nr:hypothetical protein [Acidobacteriota bacterium]